MSLSICYLTNMVTIAGDSLLRLFGVGIKIREKLSDA